MTQNIGTYDISTLLAARFQSAAAWGLDTIQTILNAELAAHNAIVGELVAEMCDVTTDRQRRYGSSVAGEMIEVDEYGQARTQNPVVGDSCGFPLRLFQFNLGWTRKWFETATPADVAQGVIGAEVAHLREVQRQLKRAIFASANFTWNDFLVDKVDLYIKRFSNADSAKIPAGPNGEVFDGSTHTHFSYAASLTAAHAKAVITNVIEHGFGGTVKLAISKSDETTFRALTGFVAYPDPRLVLQPTTTAALYGANKLDVSRLDNRAIGVFEGAEVWVKPWCPQYYQFAWDAANAQKPLGYRQRTQQTLQGLRIAAEIDEHPLYARFMEAEFGIGVWTRTNGACGYSNSGSAWADATIS